MSIKLLLAVIFITGAYQAYGQGNEAVLQELAIQLEKMRQEIDQNSLRITENFVLLEKRVAIYSNELASLGETRKNINTKYEKILTAEAELKNLAEKFSNYEAELAVIGEKLNQFDKDLDATKNAISSTEKIATWVTLIVSVLVVLIGLFFSKRFLEIYSNYKVLYSHLPEKQRQQMGLDSGE